MKTPRQSPPARRSSVPHPDRWLLSYADFVTLLLALFLVLYASARQDAEQSRGLIEGLQAAFSLGASPDDPSLPDRAAGLHADDDRESVEEQTASGSLAPLERLESRLNRELERLQTRLRKEPGIQVHPSERGLVISLAAAEYFPAGDAAIAPERRALLDAIAPLLAAETGSLHFEGHTDDRPVERGPYPSNWELSGARAAALARYFIDEHGLDAQRIAATGYADQRPVDPGTTPAARARNRRVEIVVLADSDASGAKGPGPDERSLDRLLERLPPVADETPAGLRPSAPGPKPIDVPLP